MKSDPKMALRMSYLMGRRGAPWPRAWARARAHWEGACFARCSSAWNAGRQDAGLFPQEVLP